MQDWNTRLKEARKNKGYTLSEVSKRLSGSDHVSVQSLITYEAKENYPKLNVFIALCNLYEVSPEYIIYGKEKESYKLNDKSQKLFCLFMLLNTNKIELVHRNLIKINDEELITQLNLLNNINENIDFTNINSMISLIQMINEMSNN